MLFISANGNRNPEWPNTPPIFSGKYNPVNKAIAHPYENPPTNI